MTPEQLAESALTSTPIRKEDALAYHSGARKGKIAITPTVPMATLRDLALAYSPGVAYPCLEIAENPARVYDYTARGNIVAVISNGTAVLGLGNIGPEAAKPVMEGKAILFKKYADIDGVDVELNVTTVEELVAVIKALEPTYGGINLEDIKAPECFEVEQRLRAEMQIPIMHDDQHGTAIISCAAVLNALELNGKKLDQIQMVISGAGASAIACANMYIALGLRRENILMTDSKGVLHTGRTDLDQYKQAFATTRTDVHTLEDCFNGADVFVGLSKANLVTQDMMRRMAKDPIVFALANPDPEIRPEAACQVRPDVIMATGRSDYPNQVNNVLGFPYIFRGALDVRARTINEAMKLAAARAIARLAHEPVPDVINQIYGGKGLHFGPDYLIPKPMDPRLLIEVSLAVAQAAVESGVADAPPKSWDEYRLNLAARGGQYRAFMRSIVTKAQRAPQRVAFPESEHYKVLKAAQELQDEGLAQPVLVGDPQRIQRALQEYEIELPQVEIIDPFGDEALLERFAQDLYQRRQRKGLTLVEARTLMLQRQYYANSLLRHGLVDALVTGQTRSYATAIRPALDVIGREEGHCTACGLYILRTDKQVYFLADTTINRVPTEDQLVDIATLTARAVRTLGFTPRVAMLSYTNFGANADELAHKVSRATRRLQNDHPDLIIDGELQANFALRPDLLKEYFPFSRLAEQGANTLIFPNLAAANIAYKLLQEVSEVEAVGPILLGMDRAVHIMQMGCSVREIVNLSAIAVLDAQSRR